MSAGPGGTWPRLWSSVFAKIIGVLLVATFAINWINTQAVRLAREAEQRTRGTYVRQYAGDLQSRLGDPPLMQEGRRLARSGNWRLAFVADRVGKGWATEAGMPSLDEMRPYLVGEDWGTYRNSFFYLSPRRAGTLIMMTPPRYESLGWKFQSLRIGGVVGVMLALWLCVSWILVPVRWLDRGVALVAAGELGHRVPTRENDELGRLAMQFNAMTEQIQAMFEQRRRLLLDVSHELRTPLTRLKLGLEAMADDETRAGLAEDVEELELLVNELIEGARLTHGRSQLQVETLDLAGLVRETADSARRDPPGLVVDVPESLVLSADPVRLQRLIQNLLNNAFAHGQPARGPVSVTLTRSGNEASLSVADQGPGVPPEHLPLLFTPFFRSDRSRARATGGVGLGLSLCLGIARAHGGDLKAGFASGGGLVFTLTLPLVP